MGVSNFLIGKNHSGKVKEYFFKKNKRYCFLQKSFGLQEEVGPVKREEEAEVCRYRIGK
jgi:hypothetical protein